MNLPHSLVWLHLSDLHLCESKTGWDCHRVLVPLLEDLRQMEASRGLKPDLIFFTGDAAFGNIKDSSLAEQYAQVAQFFDSVRQAFSAEVPKENVFLVPGNHDVDRAETTEADSEWLDKRTKQSEINSLLQEAGKPWQRYMERLAAYRQFLETYGYSHLLADPQRLIYSAIREFAGVKIGIGGLNSAWSCGRDDERGRIWLGGDWQSGEIIRRLKAEGADIRVGLLHHPFGWFTQYEDPSLRPLFEREFHALLHGHEHQGWVDAKADGHVRIAAGACYESAWMENGYNFVRLDLDSGKAEVWLRRYDSQGGGWVSRPVARQTGDDGCWPLDGLPWLKALSAIQPPQIDDAGPTFDAGQFGAEVRLRIAELLRKPVLEPVRNALSQGTADEAAAVLVPVEPRFDPGASVLALHKASDEGLAQCANRSPKQLPEASKLAEQVLGWLLLLAVSEEWVAKQGSAFGESAHVNILAIPGVKEEASVELVLARLSKRMGQWYLDPADDSRLTIRARTGVAIGAEVGFGPQALPTLKESLWQKLHPGDDPRKRPGWEQRLKRDLERESVVYQRTYFVAVPQINGVSACDLGLLAELRRDLPVGTFQIGIDGDKVLMVPEPDLISDINAFLVLLDNYLNRQP